MFCKKCGNQLDDGVKFCSKCENTAPPETPSETSDSDSKSNPQTNSFDSVRDTVAAAAKDASDLIGKRAKAAAGQVGADISKGARAAQDKAKEYAPIARGAVLKTLEQSRLATGTGIKVKTLIVGSVLLLIGCMVLPLALGWSIYLSSQGVQNKQSGNRDAPVYMRGATKESMVVYQGYQYSALFQPLQLSDSSLKTGAAVMTVLAGPMLITGSSIALQGSHSGVVDAQQPNSMSASAELTLGNAGTVGWLFLAAVVLLLVIADFAIGDIYAMQKVVAALIVSWFFYCVTIGFVVQELMRNAIAQATGSSQLGLSFDGFAAAPMKIAAIGGLYWVGSMFLRRMMKKQL